MGYLQERHRGGALLALLFLAGTARCESVWQLDAQNLLYAYRFGGEASLQRTLNRMISSPKMTTQRAYNTATATSNLVQASKEFGILPAAEAFYERTVRNKPYDAEVRRQLAVCYFAGKKAAKAAQAQHLAIQYSKLKSAEDRGLLQLYLAVSLKDHGFVTLARKAFELPEVRQVRKFNRENVAFENGLGPAIVGLMFEDMGSRPGRVRISHLYQDYPADHAGVRAGDELVRVGTAGVHDAEEAASRFAGFPEGSVIPVRVRRGGQVLDLSITKTRDSGLLAAEALSDRGVDLAGRGDFQGAMALFEQARRVGPHHAKSWFNTGLVAARLGRSRQALECFLSALALGLQPSVAAQLRAQVNQLTHSVGGNPEMAFSPAMHAKRNSAVAMGQRGEHVKSYMVFLGMLRDSPGYPGALLGAAFVEKTLGLTSVAIEHFEAYLRAYPHAPNSYAIQQTVAQLRGGYAGGQGWR